MSARAAAVAIVAAGAACGFTARSHEFSCDGDGDCATGRACVAGYCVVVVEPAVDAASDAAIDARAGDAASSAHDGAPAIDAETVPPPDAGPFVCPPACTTCNLGTCVIHCAAPGSCATPIVCPAGLPCKVECEGDPSCTAGIDCGAATSCRIECVAPNSCGGAITCGEGVCRVECIGAASCAMGIDCSTSCQCDTFCDGLGSCALGSTCPGPAQCTDGLECTGVPGPCNTC